MESEKLPGLFLRIRRPLEHGTRVRRMYGSRSSSAYPAAYSRMHAGRMRWMEREKLCICMQKDPSASWMAPYKAPAVGKGSHPPQADSWK